ncbi:MAG: aminopeptidase P family protein [Saprospiraceae bacterium]|nr:aminopeptidase P family protein [Saprospiraceae bacterium]MCB0577479.1 aminopeptidase P family protein [Saprospiraceae bacterium]MCB9355418.1 aminopeptidase P family protein [Lewinellaceae bacterium]
MFSENTYRARRTRLKKDLGSGLLFFTGNNEVGMNYAGNDYHFRQDSNFLYFFGIDKPGLAAVIDIDADRDIIFGDDLSIEDVVWMGAAPRMKTLAAQVGVQEVLPFRRLLPFLKKNRRAGRAIHYLPPYRHDNMLLLKDALNIPVAKQKTAASEAFIRAVVAQRAHKSDEEVAEMERAVDVSGEMHVAAMKAAREGQREAELAGLVEGIAVSGGGHLSYPVILTVNGQILHNHYHGNTLQKGQMVLGDFGAETAMHYAGDITRTFPVAGKFTTRQREIYEIVLDAEIGAIASLKPGIPYRDVHLAAARRMAEGLRALGLMRGNLDEAVAQGAHALFFPHGLGHMIGMDVHDMEDLGENYVGYSENVRRSEQFGTAYLRLARALEPGFVLTVEPGIYFIPQLIDQWRRKKKFEEFINYPALKKYRDFGGIRIEDNVLITENGHRILGNPIPKTVEAVENLRKG